MIGTQRNHDHHFMCQVQNSKNKDWFVESWNRHRDEYSTANDILSWTSLAVIGGLVAPFFQQARAHQRLRDGVRVAVGGRAPVLEVALLVLPHRARDADAGPAVGHAGRELVDARGFVTTSEASGVVEPAFGVVGPDVIPVSLRQPFDGVLDDSAEEEELQTHQNPQILY